MPAVKKQKRRPDRLTIENARILFRNFSGRPGRYNAEGIRNFCVIIDDELAERLDKEDWNVKWLKPRDEGDIPQAYIPVRVSYKNFPPRVILITSNNKTELDEDNINILDFAEIVYVDLIINPSVWDVNDKTGVKAYLRSMYVTIAEDDLENKYRDVPDSALSSIEDEVD